jgi:hypothetical protein
MLPAGTVTAFDAEDQFAGVADEDGNILWEP